MPGPADPTVDDLAKVPLLSGLPTPVLGTLAERFEVEEHPAGAAILTEGRAGYAFYVLAEGLVAVLHDGRLLRQLGPGDYFGEIAIMGEGRRTASVVAATPVVVWVLFGTVFRTLQTSDPEVTDALTAAMAERLATD